MIMTCDDEPEERPPKPKKPRAVKTKYAVALAIDNDGQEHAVALAVDSDGRVTEFVQSGTRKELKGKKKPPKAKNDSRALLSANRKLMNFQSLGSCIKRAGRAQEEDVTTRASTCNRPRTCAWGSSMHSKFATTTMTTRASAASARRHTSASAYASLSPSSSCSAYTLQVS